MTATIIEDIGNERARQRAKFPEDRDHDLFVMLAVIGEEFGECQQAALDHLQAVDRGDASVARHRSQHFRAELVQLAACAVKALTLYDAGRLAIYGDQLSTDQTAETQPINPS